MHTVTRAHGAREMNACTGPFPHLLTVVALVAPTPEGPFAAPGDGAGREGPKPGPEYITPEQLAARRAWQALPEDDRHAIVDGEVAEVLRASGAFASDEEQIAWLDARIAEREGRGAGATAENGAIPFAELALRRIEELASELRRALEREHAQGGQS